jgi:hypothetical protein
MNKHRVHEIVYGFGGTSEKKSVLVNFLLQNTNLVSFLVMSDRTDKFCELDKLNIQSKKTSMFGLGNRT